MPFVSRAEWGARKPKSAGNSISSHPKGVAVHYEGPKMGSRDHSKCAALVRSIQDFHMDTRGWADIAYSFPVCEHGYVYEGRGVGKGSAANGTTAANLAYYAVCGLVGKGDNVTSALTDGIREAIDICRRAGAGNEVVGHRDLFATECPGDVLYSFAKAGAPYSATVSTGGMSAHAPAPVPVVQPVKAAPKPTAAALTVDGDLGPATIKRLQQVLGTAVDGAISKPSSSVVKAMQKRLGITQDGDWGPATTRALQKRYGTPVDGVISQPSTVIKALQKALNAGKF